MDCQLLIYVLSSSLMICVGNQLNIARVYKILFLKIVLNSESDVEILELRVLKCDSLGRSDFVSLNS